jgi:chemotaxis protein MotB
MAGKGGGGSWKVAYADFVTAMMAFFLVMWICAQDQKMKEAVAHYFMDPLGGSPIGAATKPGKSGSVFEKPGHGSVPDADKVAMGRGRSSYTKGEAGPSTKLVGDWLHADEKAQDYWREQARQARAQAEQAPTVRDKVVSVDQMAVQILAKQLQEEMKRKVPNQIDGLQQDLLYVAMSEVNWTELAEDILTHLD